MPVTQQGLKAFQKFVKDKKGGGAVEVVEGNFYFAINTMEIKKNHDGSITVTTISNHVPMVEERFDLSIGEVAMLTGLQCLMPIDTVGAA